MVPSQQLGRSHIRNDSCNGCFCLGQGGLGKSSNFAKAIPGARAIGSAHEVWMPQLWRTKFIFTGMAEVLREVMVVCSILSSKNDMRRILIQLHFTLASFTRTKCSRKSRYTLIFLTIELWAHSTPCHCNWSSLVPSDSKFDYHSHI